MQFDWAFQIILKLIPFIYISNETEGEILSSELVLSPMHCMVERLDMKLWCNTFVIYNGYVLLPHPIGNSGQLF